jgi:phage terminase small subunit
MRQVILRAGHSGSTNIWKDRMETKTKKAPNFLKTEGRKFWRGVLSEYEITETHDLKLLAEASSCADRIFEARAEIEKSGPYFIDRWKQPKPHPAHAIENANKILFARLLRELNLDVQMPESRPPQRY